MRFLKLLMRLQKPDGWLLIEAAVTLGVIRMMLQFLSLRMVQRAALVLCTCCRSSRHCVSDRIVWAVQKTGSVAGSNCLMQALAAQAMLVRYNYKPSLNIGVAKNESLSFEAHAWVTSENQILIGGPESGHYTTILTLGSLS